MLFRIVVNNVEQITKVGRHPFCCTCHILLFYCPRLIFGRPFVKRFPMLSDRCLSVLSYLSVTLVYCSQTVGWIKMISTWRGGRPRPRPHCVRWDPAPSGCMDPDATWGKGRGCLLVVRSMPGWIYWLNADNWIRLLICPIYAHQSVN